MFVCGKCYVRWILSIDQSKRNKRRHISFCNQFVRHFTLFKLISIPQLYACRTKFEMKGNLFRYEVHLRGCCSQITYNVFGIQVISFHSIFTANLQIYGVLNVLNLWAFAARVFNIRDRSNAKIYRKIKTILQLAHYQVSHYQL